MWQIFNSKKCMLLFLVVAFLLSGCGATETKTENGTREVSSEIRLFGQGPGLNVEQDLKESGVAYEDEPIQFQDKAVEEMLRNIIGKPKGEVYVSELQDIHAIYWRGSGYWSNLQSPNGYLPWVSGGEEPWKTKQPKNLEDLAYCYNLQWMEFGSGVEVPSLEPLSNLPQLETLKFSQARVTEKVFCELLDLPQLKSLSFSETNVTAEMLEVIGQLPMLTSLELGHYEYVYGLGTDWGELTDGSFVLPLADQLTHLVAEGGIDWNPEVLAQMTKLESLRIDYAEDVSFLEHMTELKKLSMYCCTPKDWSPLSYLDNLEHLEVGGNMKKVVAIELDDLHPLKNLDYLEITFTSINEENSRKEIIEALPSLTGLVNTL